MEVIILFILILLNGIFSMSEIALVSARKIRLENAAKKGNKQAKEALKLMNNPGKFLSTVQIGITVIGILTGIYSGEKIADDFRIIIEKVPMLKNYADTISVIAILIILTFFSLVLGELVPKKIGLSNPEGISKVVAQPMKILSLVAAPFVWVLTFTTDLIIKIFGIKPSQENVVTEEEIKAIVQEGTEAGEIQDIEQDIVGRVFSLGDRKVASLMTHRSDMVCILKNDSKETILKKIKNDLHSNYPVLDEYAKEIIGVVKMKEIVFELFEKEFSLDKFIHQPNFIPENASAYQALKTFRENKIHYALVTDEFGHTEGIISLNDILEALAGNADDFAFDEPSIVQWNDNSWLVDGQYPFADFLHYFEMESLLPEYKYNTMSGLILDEIQNLPKPGDKITWNNFIIEIIDMDGARIDKILIKKPE